MGFPLGNQYIPAGLPNYRVQQFDNGQIIVIIYSTYYRVEAWLNGGPMIMARQWPLSDFPQ